MVFAYYNWLKEKFCCHVSKKKILELHNVFLTSFTKNKSDNCYNFPTLPYNGIKPTCVEETESNVPSVYTPKYV